MNEHEKKLGIRIVAVGVLGLAVLAGSASRADPEGSGIVSSVENAPVVPDGTVAGAVTDFVINLDTSLDPAVPGRELAAGGTIKVTLPEGFVNTGTLPLEDVFSSPSCVPGNLQCSTAALLQGWPQHPILPRFPPAPPGTGMPQYSLSLEDDTALVFTADIPLVAGVPLPGPGIKQLHLILNGFRNPTQPGFYPILVEAETEPGGATETGVGIVHILPETRPHIGVTSALNPGAPNTIYQTTGTNELTPLPYDFLIWDRAGGPFVGVTAGMVSDRLGLLRRGERAVGIVTIDSPPGAVGQEVTTVSPSMEINAPITGVPTALLTVEFRVGSVPGDYAATFALLGGTSVTMFVTAVAPD